MSLEKDGKPGNGPKGPGAKFDTTDDEKEDTQPDVAAARERRRIALVTLGGMVNDVHVDLIRAAQAELGLRLGTLEERMTTMVDRVIDLMVSDQEHDEVLIDVKKELKKTREQVDSLLDWLKGNHGP